MFTWRDSDWKTPLVTIFVYKIVILSISTFCRQAVVRVAPSISLLPAVLKSLFCWVWNVEIYYPTVWINESISTTKIRTERAPKNNSHLIPVVLLRSGLISVVLLHDSCRYRSAAHLPALREWFPLRSTHSLRSRRCSAPLLPPLRDFPNLRCAPVLQIPPLWQNDRNRGKTTEIKHSASKTTGLS